MRCFDYGVTHGIHKSFVPPSRSAVHSQCTAVNLKASHTLMHFVLLAHNRCCRIPPGILKNPLQDTGVFSFLGHH